MYPVLRHHNPDAVEIHVYSSGKRDAVTCLLYTSDAADERSSVDLGGRRIIKTKKWIKTLWRVNTTVKE